MPFLGICLGMQCAAIEFGRNVVQSAGSPFDGVRQGHAAPLDLFAGRTTQNHPQGRDDAFGSTTGAVLTPGSRVAECYEATEISERHRHRYEFNNVYRQQFAAHGMHVTGASPDGKLVEVLELPTTPGSSPFNSIPSFAPSRPRPARCSPVSLAPPSAAAPNVPREASIRTC